MKRAWTYLLVLCLLLPCAADAAKARAASGVTASGDRYDSADESPATRLPGYAILDAAVRYRLDKRTVLEFSGSNLADKRYEHAVAYEAPRRAVLFSIRFEGS